ncbi:MAG: hypothetical protein KAH48_07120 [Chlorobi bacterium]|nr:hypothetical protein [Chlorobiota bacterium]
MNSEAENQVSASDNQIFLFARQAIYNHFSDLMSYKVLLPGYLPIGVHSPFNELGSKKLYYKVGDDLSLPIDFPGSHSPDNTIIYYIHHFGMYNHANIKRLKQLKLQGYYIVEDRALTLPTAKADYFGDATVYSFNKMLGIPHGGMVIDNKQTQQHSPINIKESDLWRSYLSIRMKLFSHFGISLMPQAFFRIYNKISWNIINKKGDNLPHWLDANAPADSKISDILHNADYQAISDKITFNAGYLYDNIRQNLQLLSGREDYTTQAVTGFPIIIDNPKDFQKYLIKNGIHGFSLSDAWRPDNAAPIWEYTFKHFLLPTHNDLRKKDLEKIVRVVNAYMG